MTECFLTIKAVKLSGVGCLKGKILHAVFSHVRSYLSESCLASSGFAGEDNLIFVSLLPPKSKGDAFLHFDETCFDPALVFAGLLCELAHFPEKEVGRFLLG